MLALGALSSSTQAPTQTPTLGPWGVCKRRHCGLRAGTRGSWLSLPGLRHGAENSLLDMELSWGSARGLGNPRTGCVTCPTAHRHHHHHHLLSTIN